MSQTVHRQCTLCEAHCGIDVEVDGDRVLRITGDAITGNAAFNSAPVRLEAAG
jgi:anaerobic selenocysteine-containing dehydrogenase